MSGARSFACGRVGRSRGGTCFSSDGRFRGKELLLKDGILEDAFPLNLGCEIPKLFDASYTQMLWYFMPFSIGILQGLQRLS